MTSKMDSSVHVQRGPYSQRRQQTHPDPSEQQQPPNAAAMSTSASTGSASQPRAGSGSGRSQRISNPDKQISQIEKSVTHLLVATKQLLETLTQWSRGQAQEEEVSDVYVRLGYEFNLACRAFNSIGVETADLGNVPDLLRHILEDTLSQPASPQALDTYLPRIRDIIINLLHGLKRKQSKLRGKGSKEVINTSRAGVSSSSEPARAASAASTTGSNETGLTQMLDDVPSTTGSSRAGSRLEGLRSDSAEPQLTTTPAPTVPTSLSRGSINRKSMRRDAPIAQSESDSSMSSTTMQSLPVQPPLEEDTTPRPASTANFPHPPPPPPKQDALAALQRGGDLERRASRRFSAYQISKHLGASPNGVPVLPPPQFSPIPNRGREARESMRAVQSRTSTYRTKSFNKGSENSPSRSGTVRIAQSISEEGEEGTPQLDSNAVPKIHPPLNVSNDVDSPTAKTPDEYKPRSPLTSTTRNPMFSATLNGPMSPVSELQNELPTPSDEKPPPPPEHQEPLQQDLSSSPATVERKASTRTPPQSQIISTDSSPPQGKELTLFLQYKTKIKKFVLADGYEELTTARLQLAFIEKFAWNTHNDGLDLPEIYIQDPVSGVRHELEDLGDVKDRAVLVLNVEPLDEVKRHFDDGIGGLHKTLEGFKGLLEGQGSLMQRFSDRQLEASKEMARMSAVPTARTPRTPVLAQGEKGRMVSPPPNGANLQEVQNLRRDIAVLRQTYSSMTSDFTSAMNDIKVKAANVKQVAAEASVPSYKGDAGRQHIIDGKKQISDDSERLLARGDDLADTVEELRKDVVQRGVRPLPRQLEDVSRDLAQTIKELRQLKDFVKKQKPVWTKIWEQELQTVMDEREDLTQREDIISDLEQDLEDANEIFNTIEEATKQQNLQAQSSTQTGIVGLGVGGLRSTSRNLPEFDNSGLDPHEAKEGVLDQVRGLSISHEDRVEAIERAEKARQKELAGRKGNVFHQEVETFVGEGKLRKTGGADEVERRRKIADEKAMKENWETMERKKREVEERRAEKARRMAEEAARAKAAEENGEHQPASNDTSQEGEVAFQDAPERTDEKSPTPPAKDNHIADGPPQLPEITNHEASGDKNARTRKTKDEGHETEPPTSPAPSTNSNRASRSWWQPAVFG